MKLAKTRDVGDRLKLSVFLHDVFKETGGLPLASAHQRVGATECSNCSAGGIARYPLEAENGDVCPSIRSLPILVESAIAKRVEIRRPSCGEWEASSVKEEDCGKEAKLAELLSRTGHDAKDVLAAAKSEEIGKIYAARTPRRSLRVRSARLAMCSTARSSGTGSARSSSARSKRSARLLGRRDELSSRKISRLQSLGRSARQIPKLFEYIALLLENRLPRGVPWNAPEHHCHNDRIMKSMNRSKHDPAEKHRLL